MFKIEPKEKIILEVRKHWFVIFIDGFLLFVIALAPLLVFYFADKFFLAGKEINIGGEFIYLFSFAYFLWLLAMWVAFFISWTEFYLDVWYITDSRIIAIDQKGLFRREIIDLRYEKVQDVTVEVNGIIQTLLGFGTLHVQTAAEISKILMRHVKNPFEAKRIILLHHSESIGSRGREHHIIE